MGHAPRIRKAHLVDKQWRVSLPPNVRKALGVQPGDGVAYDVEGNRVVVFRVEITRAKH